MTDTKDARCPDSLAGILFDLSRSGAVYLIHTHGANEWTCTYEPSEGEPIAVTAPGTYEACASVWRARDAGPAPEPPRTPPPERCPACGSILPREHKCLAGYVAGDLTRRMNARTRAGNAGRRPTRPAASYTYRPDSPEATAARRQAGRR